MLFYNETYKDVYNELVFYNINRLFSTFYNVFDRVLPQKQDKYMICMYSERFVFVVAYNKNDINSFYVQVFCIFYKLMFCDTLRIFCIPLYIEYVHIYIYGCCLQMDYTALLNLTYNNEKDISVVYAVVQDWLIWEVGAFFGLLLTLIVICIQLNNLENRLLDIEESNPLLEPLLKEIP
jgi:hypothetical protein